MTTIKPNNPFLIAGYYSPDYFCDREQETEQIINALYNGRNLTLIAPRRMGKTGLIKHAFYKLHERQPDIITLYFDIYSTQNLNEFVQAFASTVLGSLDSVPQKAIARISQFIKSCRPVFTLDELSGMPEVSIDIAPEKEEVTLKEIFSYLLSSEKRCYIAIDEFQQITEYPEKGIEALLRSYIQFLPNIHFIFAGSRQHVMQDMFLSAKRPFYQSTQTMTVGCIDQEAYFDFAASWFNSRGLTLDKETFNSIYDEFEGHTWYIQAILNRLYGYSDNPDLDKVSCALREIVAENEYGYQNLLAAYTPGAIRLVKAIARERVVREINAGSFISKYKLKAASSVNASLRTLTKMETVYRTENGYIVYDRFFAIWLRQQPY